jgi:hypothetical protein
MNLLVSESEADAIKAVAEATGTALQVLQSIGSFVKNTVGSVPEDVIGIIGGDWLSEKRKRIKAALEDKTAERLSHIDRGRISEPSPSLLLPLLTSACEESREPLQDLWASLLAAAMTDGGAGVRREFFVVAAKMEPQDTVALRAVSGYPQPVASNVSTHVAQNRAWWINECKSNGLNELDGELAVEALLSLQLVVKSSMGFPVLTSLGRGLLRAVEIPST